MRWDGFFADLEDQLASEWEAERAALETETERLRLACISLSERLAQLTGRGADAPVLSFDLSDGATIRASLAGVGADCVALLAVDGVPRTAVAPLTAIVSIGMPHHDLVRSIRPAADRPGLSARLTFGYVMRDLVRRRAGVSVHLAAGRALHGTIDRAGADHLDLALHDPGAPRRSDAVTGYRVVAFESISWVRVDNASPLL